MMNNKIRIMGILNVTPDSFSDGGFYNDIEKAKFRVETMIKEGADIIDIGGESSRQGSTRISSEEELDRIIPVLSMIKSNFDIKVSIDTYKASVAEECLKNKADIINDITGFTFDPDMISTAAEFKPECIIMHIKGDVYNMHDNHTYENIVDEVKEFLYIRAEKLSDAGIEKITLDPGFGFSKSLDDNYALLKGLDKLKNGNYGLLAGISRKSMIGKVCETAALERLPGTITLNTIAVLNGADMIRVHDIKEAKQSIKVIEKYLSL